MEEHLSTVYDLENDLTKAKDENELHKKMLLEKTGMILNMERRLINLSQL